VTAIAASPDGRWLAVGLAGDAGRGAAVHLLDAAGPKKAGAVLPHPTAVTRLAFCPLGRTLFVVGRSARLWRIAGRRELPAEVQDATAAVFTADGASLFAGASDGTVRRLDTQTGATVGRVLQLPQRVEALALAPDGRQLVVAGRDGSAWLFDLGERPRQLGPPWVQAGPIVAASFAPDGRSVLTTAVDGTTRRWPVPRVEDGTPERLTRLAEVLTGQSSSPAESLTPLTASVWEKRAHGLPVLLELDEASWHDARAADAAQDGDLFAARWHLDAALRLGSADRALYFRRGLVHARAGRFDLAAQDHDRAAGGAAGRTAQWENGLASCQALGEWKAALWYVGQLLKERPGDHRLLQEQAEAQRRLDGGER
jgi:WD40 repeat protein